MTEPILETSYWKERLAKALAKDKLHQSVFECPLSQWQAIEAKHRKILSHLTRANDSILDAGCGYGRLLDLMPRSWQGSYLGVDLSPDFISLAKQLHPKHSFIEMDLTQSPLYSSQTYDWAVAISMRPMIKRNLGDEAWERVESVLRTIAKKILILEYDATDPGYVISSDQPQLTTRKISHE